MLRRNATGTTWEDWFLVCRAMPSLQRVVIGSRIWGLFPETWSSLASLQHVVLFGDNRMHGLPLGAGPFSLLSVTLWECSCMVCPLMGLCWCE
jgi:hypothetical protein